MKAEDYINDILEVEKTKLKGLVLLKEISLASEVRVFTMWLWENDFNSFLHMSYEEVLESMFLEVPSKTDFLWLAFMLPQTTLEWIL